MALLPTGSNKLLEIQTAEVNITIKAKKTWNSNMFDTSSSVVVEGFDVKQVRVDAFSIRNDYDSEGFAIYALELPPLFFEQTDYEIIIYSHNHKNVTFNNENHSIQEKIGQVRDGDDSLISGIVNFGNMVGYCDFDVLLEGRKYIRVRIEVFPSKISYKEDYRLMIADISEMVCEAAFDFMQKTYQTFSLDDKKSSTIAVYFQILRRIFGDYINAVNRIINVPNHKLITEHQVVQSYKAKRTDKATEKWILRHNDCMILDERQITIDKILAVKKKITYDTEENRFVKFVLFSTLKKLDEFKRRYVNAYQNVEETVVDEIDNMSQMIKQVLNNSFLKDVSTYTASNSMSLVFGMAPGYRELYKCYIMLNRSLSVNGDVFKMSPKDTAQLYEYWCFIKLFSLLKKEYNLVSPDIIRVDNTGITITLIKGKKSEAKFIDPKSGELITLTYNPGESETQTVNQRPDNVLQLEKKGSQVLYKYVFDAKYRIENNPNSVFYPDSNPGPKVDDINTMHRYRDSIVYENPNSKFSFEKTMFGAYILFPYADEEKYKGHRFYKSIEKVNIGGLPFLPGATELVKKLLSELISDSKESAFERTSLPIGIEEKLKHIDWEKRDVLIAAIGSKEEFDACLNNRIYVIPEKNIKYDNLPIHYVTLYQTKLGFGDGEIRFFGEVIELSKVKGRTIVEIPIRSEDGEEIFYRIKVKEWKEISSININKKPILPKESGFKVNYTNMFLLENSEFIPELQIKSEEEYRFYYELKRHANLAGITNADENSISFVYEDTKFLFTEGKIFAVKDNRIISQASITEFARKPSIVFRYLRNSIC